MKGELIFTGYNELLCKIEIQERALEVIAKEVFENIGQTLCLAKMQIGALTGSGGIKEQKKITDAGQLVYKAIHDLRKMTRQADPDEIIVHGFVRGIEKEVALLRSLHDHIISLKVKGKYPEIIPGKELFIFCLLQEIIQDNFFSLKTLMADIIITYLKKDITIQISQVTDKEKSFTLSDGAKKKISQLGASIVFTETRRHKKLLLTIKKQHGQFSTGG